MSDVVIGHSGPVTTVTLNRPEKMNAITREMYKSMADAITTAAADSSVSVVVIQSMGEHFTAGNDISDFLNNPLLKKDPKFGNSSKQRMTFPKF